MINAFGKSTFASSNGIHNLSLGLLEKFSSAKGKINTGHYCVSHAIALSTYGGRGSKSKIKNTTAYYGGYRDKIIYKWTGTLHSFSLLARTRRDYGEDPVSKSSYTIDYNVSSLLKI